LEDVQILTLQNLTDGAVRANNDVLYEAVKVGQYKITLDAALGADISTSAIQKLGGSLGIVKVDGADVKEAKGTDLVVAYRVVRLGAPSTKKTTQRLKGSGAYSLGDYSIRLNPGGAALCICPLTQDGKFQPGQAPTPALRGKCQTEHPFQVAIENYAAGVPGTPGVKKQMSVGWGSSDAIVLDARMTRSTVEVDILTFKTELSTMVTRACFTFGEDMFNEDLSRLELTTQSYPISTVARPSAPGW
jgi:hypothetical protein